MAGIILNLVLGQPEQTPPSVEDTFSGTAASPGVVTGVARVLQGADDLHLLGPGDILVVPTTTEAFTSGVDLISAIVTDHGGIASHAGRSRNPGGRRHLERASTVQPGSRITVDGERGLVMLDN